MLTNQVKLVASMEIRRIPVRKVSVLHVLKPHLFDFIFLVSADCTFEPSAKLKHKHAICARARTTHARTRMLYYGF